MKDRNHFYLYTVRVRRTETTDDGKKVTHWDEVEPVEACNIWEVAGKLNRHIDDVRYIHKDIIK